MIFFFFFLIRFCCCCCCVGLLLYLFTCKKKHNLKMTNKQKRKRKNRKKGLYCSPTIIKNKTKQKKTSPHMHRKIFLESKNFFFSKFHFSFIVRISINYHNHQRRCYIMICFIKNCFLNFFHFMYTTKITGFIILLSTTKVIIIFRPP